MAALARLDGLQILASTLPSAEGRHEGAGARSGHADARSSCSLAQLAHSHYADREPSYVGSADVAPCFRGKRSGCPREPALDSTPSPGAHVRAFEPNVHVGREHEPLAIHPPSAFRTLGLRSPLLDVDWRKDCHRAMTPTRRLSSPSTARSAPRGYSTKEPPADRGALNHVGSKASVYHFVLGRSRWSHE